MLDRRFSIEYELPAEIVSEQTRFLLIFSPHYPVDAQDVMLLSCFRKARGNIFPTSFSPPIGTSSFPHKET